ncbi:MAG: cadherin-like beta sandwich domain-containing protein [Planctomycetota bacterium]
MLFVRCVLVAFALALLTACPSRSRPPSSPGLTPVSDLLLLDLVLSIVPLEPEFRPDLTDYTATVGPDVDAISVTAVAPPGASGLSMNDVAVASALPSPAIVLLPGANAITIVVTGADGVTTKTYNVAVTRIERPVLTGLAVAPGTLAPEFAGTTKEYQAAVAFLDRSVRVTASAADGVTILVGAETVVSGQPSSPIALREGENVIVVRVTDANAVTRDYRLIVRRAPLAEFAQEAYGKASNTGTNDEFGLGIALDGDTLVVGAPREDSAATGINGVQNNEDAANSGAVYVFVRDGTTWQQQAYIKASNTGAGDFFGVCVAVRGDTMAVGAYLEDSNATGIGGDQGNNSAVDSGAVYVFTRSAGVWTQEAYVKASNTDGGDGFGIHVSLGDEMLVVGAFSEDSAAVGIDGNQADNSANESGAAYVFTRSAGTWTQQAYVKASNTGAGDQFGVRTALAGETLVVGAYLEDSAATGIGGAQGSNGAPDSGAVYVFTRDGATWTQQAYVKASNTGGGDGFGIGLAIDGDTMAVGAWQEDSNATGIGGNQANNSAGNSGAAYVFTRDGGTWTQQAYVKASNTGGGDQFGQRVALHGDNLVVGAPQEDSVATGINGNQASNGAGNSGACYLFLRTGGSWAQAAYVKATNTGASDLFGVRVALDGNTLVAAATAEGSEATGINGSQTGNLAPGSGAIYVLR